MNLKKHLCAIAAALLVGPLALLGASSEAQATSTVVDYDVASGGSVRTKTSNIAASPDGSVYVAGKYRDTATWGSIQLSSSQEAGYLAKLGPDGVWDWVVDAKSHNDYPPPSLVRDVVALDDGSAIFLIDAGSDMGFTNPVTGAAEAFSTTGNTSIVARIAADGTFMWFKELHGSPNYPLSIALSADGSTAVVIAVDYSATKSAPIQVEAINSATGSSEWVVGNIVFSAGAGRASFFLPQVAINDSGTAVVSFAYSGGDVVVNGVPYNSKDNNNTGNGAHQTIFVAYDISTSNVEWVSRTRKSATVNVGGSSEATAGFYDIAASGDNFLVLMKVLDGDSNGTVDFADASDTADLSYNNFYLSSDEEEGFIVAELSDTGDWVEKTRVTYCAGNSGSDCGFSSVYDEKSLHVASDGSFDIFSSTDGTSGSIAGMDLLGADDTAFVASFNSDGSPEKLTSFSDCVSPGWYNAIDSFSDGTLVIAGTQDCDGPIGDSLGNTVTTNTTRTAEFVMPLANGPWVYNTPAPDSYTISYDTDGGSEAPTSTDCLSGTLVSVTSDIPTKEGHQFVNWLQSGPSDTPTTFSPGDDIDCNGSITLVAQWTQVSYYITFDPNMQTGQGVYFTCFEGENFVTNNSPDYPGYNFVAWQNSNTLEEHAASVSLPCDGHKNFSALWDPASYTVSYSANGGNGAPASQSCVDGETITLPSTTPARSGYTFSGWDTGTVDSFGQQIIFQPGDDINCGNGDLTLTAMWEVAIVNYDVAYEYGNGDPDTVLTCEEGTSFTVADAPTRQGYEFTRWARLGSPSGTFGFSNPGDTVPCDEDVALTAQWEAGNYTITYALGNGEPDATLTCQASESGPLSVFIAADAPARQWFIFDGWTTQDLGVVQPGALVTCADMTLTAIWSADTTDTDGDGVIDSEEETGCADTKDCDSDGLTDDIDTDDLDADQDNDEVLDGDEESGCITVADCDSDGLDDFWDNDDSNPDQDGDGIEDGQESFFCMTDPDCDADGLTDGSDPDPSNPDVDGDGVLDGGEQAPECVTSVDCDNDGLPDREDIDDLNADQDNDGVLDGDEQSLACAIHTDCDSDGLDDNTDEDDLDRDQDDDGVLDGNEESGCITAADCDSGGLTDDLDTDDLDSDQDDDGVMDGDEEEGCVTSVDCDSDGLNDDADTNDLNPDQDDDGILDGSEQDASCAVSSDCDSDGLDDNVDEDDLNPDQDGDGVMDGGEEEGCVTSVDCDSDGISDYEDPNDTDPTAKFEFYAEQGVTGIPGDMYVSAAASALIPENTPSKDGYVFVGWSSSKDGTTPVFKPGSRVSDFPAGVLNLYPLWELPVEDLPADDDNPDPVLPATPGTGGIDVPPGELPETGTDVNATRWLLIATLGTLMLVVARRKRRKEQNFG